MNSFVTIIIITDIPRKNRWIILKIYEEFLKPILRFLKKSAGLPINDRCRLPEEEDVLSVKHYNNTGEYPFLLQYR